MASLIPGYEYDIFISYRHKDNEYDGWVTEFVTNLKKELRATLKDDISIYFDENAQDGLLETHDVDKSLQGKITSLILIPIFSQTYCDPKSFAWLNEFLPFIKKAREDRFGMQVKLLSGNVANRILPVKIHELDAEDVQIIEDELRVKLRSVDFIYRSPGINRSLKSEDDRVENSNQYRNQINKVANAIKELIAGLRNFGVESPSNQNKRSQYDIPPSTSGVWQELKRRNVFRVATVYAIAGWLIIQIASTIFAPLHLPEWALIFLIVLVFLGFPIAMMLTWGFEKSADGTIGRTGLVSTKNKRLLGNVALLVLIAVVIGQFVYFKFLSNPIAAGETLPFDRSIAVLPFKNLTGDKDQEFISDGLTEEILNHLSQIGTIKVISRQSSMKYKDSQLTIPEIASALGVANVLEGSMRRSGDNVRITAQLIDARTDKHMWSQDYDYHDFKDIFTLQTDVSVQIAKVLKARLSEQDKEVLSKTYTANVDAYKYCLKGRYYWDKRTPKSLDSAEKYFRSAIESDPEYAVAYAGLADVYIFSPYVRGREPTEELPVVKAYLSKALSLDSTLSEALTTVGFIQSMFEYNWIKSKITLEKAIASNPNNPLGHLYYGNLLQYTGENAQRGIDEIKKALELDPLSIRLNWVLGRNYYLDRQYDLASSQLRTTLMLDSSYNLAKGTLSFVLLAQKKFPEALQLIRKLPLGTGFFPEPDRELVLSYAYAASGDPKSARAVLASVLAENRRPSHFQLARVYAILNDPNQAVAELELAYEAREALMYFIKVDQPLEPLKNNSQFKALLNKMNLR